MPMEVKSEYDITKAFSRIENELLLSMTRNLERHKAEETEKGYEWSMWQAEQLKTLEEYKKANRKKYQKQFADINKQIETMITTARDAGGLDQEIEILEAIKQGFRGFHKNHGMLQGQFFKLNDRKLEALIKATTKDMQKAETAILRMADDKYRKIIFDAQVYANSGAGTYEKAVDMAAKDMLSSGLNCVEYSNGARHKLSEYADMAIRTASKRAYLQGEGEKRKEWGISTVIMNKRGNPCPKCLPFVGKVLIDDVWSGGKQSDGSYPLMSTAIAAGLYHPRCKDGHTTYFPGISTADDTWTKKELQAIEAVSRTESAQQYASRQAEKFNRLAKYSLDKDNKQKYAEKTREWNKEASKRFENHEELEEYIVREYNGAVHKDVKELNLNQVSQTLTELEKVINDFPESKQFFSGINAQKHGGMAAVIPNGELVLNPVYYEKLHAKLIGTGFHEAGHLLELSVIKKLNPAAGMDKIREFYANSEYASKILDEAMERITTKKTLPELRREISEYAMKDEGETIAEAIADYYMNGHNAAVLSRQIVRVIGGMLNVV